MQCWQPYHVSKAARPTTHCCSHKGNNLWMGSRVSRSLLKSKAGLFSAPNAHPFWTRRNNVPIFVCFQWGCQRSFGLWNDIMTKTVLFHQQSPSRTKYSMLINWESELKCRFKQIKHPNVLRVTKFWPRKQRIYFTIESRFRDSTHFFDKNQGHYKSLEVFRNSTFG